MTRLFSGSAYVALPHDFATPARNDAIELAQELWHRAGISSEVISVPLLSCTAKSFWGQLIFVLKAAAQSFGMLGNSLGAKS